MEAIEDSPSGSYIGERKLSRLESWKLAFMPKMRVLHAKTIVSSINFSLRPEVEIRVL